MSMRKLAPTLTTLLALFLAAVFLAPARTLAQDQDQPPPQQEGDDPPTRVARISHTDGAVSFNPAGTDDWVSAVINRPMTTGDKMWADTGARAELHIGSASVRLGSTTGFSFLNLDDSVAQIQITEGTVRVRVKRLEQNETFEIDTPNLAFSVLRPGTYRINVNEAGDTTVVSVLGGEGEVTGGGQAYSVHANEVATFVGTDQLDADVQPIGGEDDFDQWCAQRDAREDHSTSARYVSPDVIGTEDLDDYGGWREEPEYGTVWFPHTTVVGWAPYRYGHWVYIVPWGYTWVEDEPWGFAPFHYGRWVVVGGVWGWVPSPAPVVGVAYVRPVYAPALVAWVGGPHFGGAVGANVGWFPLGPREVYVPAYPVSRRYVTNINVTNTRVETTVVNNYYTTVVVNKQVNVTNVTYVNQRVNGAVTATSGATFVSGQSVSRNVVRVDQREIVSTRVVAGAPAIAPTRQTYIGAGRPAAVRPPAAIATRSVVAKAPPPPPPVSFDRQQAAIRANGGRPLAATQYHQLAPPATQTAAHNNVRIAPVARTVTPVQPKSNNGAARPGQPPLNSNNVNSNNAARPGQPVNAPNNAAHPGQPVNAPPNNANAANGSNARNYNNRPPAAPSVNVPANNPQVDQQHQQQLEKLRTQQDAERQRLEQQQIQQQQKVQAQANAQKQQQLNQKQNQQLENLEHKHDTQAQKLQEKQVNDKGANKPPPSQNNNKDNNKQNKNNR
jgi:hypothetical protein